jgi:hypothetical protein
MRYDALLVMLGLLFTASPAAAQVSIGIGLPSVSIGINLPSFPELVVVPNYPVYYAPRGDVNLFFYDGMYWVYERDNWYASTWYNGPWGLVGPEIVPVFVLRIPVLYYRRPPVAWIGWGREAPPRWGERWGRDWEQRRGGWDRWDRHERHVAAPLPVYQRQYSGNRYPQAARQQALQREQYRYRPKDPVVRRVQEQRAQPQQGDRRQQDGRGDRERRGDQGNQRSSPAPQPTAPAVLRAPAPAVGATPAPAPRAAPAVQRERPQGQPADRRQPDERGQQDRDGRRSKAPAPAPAPRAVPAVEQKAPAPQPVPAVQKKQQAPRPEPVRQERSAPRAEDPPDRKSEAQEPRGQEKGQERGQDGERGQGRNR